MTPRGGARRGDGDPLVMSVAEAARLLGTSKTLAYDLVARQEPLGRGLLRLPRSGGRSLGRIGCGGPTSKECPASSSSY